MDHLAGVVPFTMVAEEKSFRRAAARLGLSAGAVSKAVKKLEEHLGCALFARTTRSVALTPEGEVYFARCREALAHLDAGRALVEAQAREPKGTLVVSLSPIVARLVTTQLAPFLARYPRLTLDLKVTDRVARLVDEKVDVALRVGAARDASVFSRVLRRTTWVTLAAPSYLAARGTPRDLAELAQHATLAYVTPQGARQRLQFAVDGETREVTARGPLAVDQGERLVDAALGGVGIAQVLDFMVEDLVRDRHLIELFPQWRASGPPITAVTLTGRRAPTKVRVLVDYLAETMRRALD